MEPMTTGAVVATSVTTTATGLLLAKSAAIAVGVGLLAYGGFKLYQHIKV